MLLLLLVRSCDHTSISRTYGAAALVTTLICLCRYRSRSYNSSFSGWLIIMLVNELVGYFSLYRSFGRPPRDILLVSQILNRETPLGLSCKQTMVLVSADYGYDTEPKVEKGNRPCTEHSFMIRSTDDQALPFNPPPFLSDELVLFPKRRMLL